MAKLVVMNEQTKRHETFNGDPLEFLGIRKPLEAILDQLSREDFLDHEKRLKVLEEAYALSNRLIETDKLFIGKTQVDPRSRIEKVYKYTGEPLNIPADTSKELPFLVAPAVKTDGEYEIKVYVEKDGDSCRFNVQAGENVLSDYTTTNDMIFVNYYETLKEGDKIIITITPGDKFVMIKRYWVVIEELSFQKR